MFLNGRPKLSYIVLDHVRVSTIKWESESSEPKYGWIRKELLSEPGVRKSQ